MSGGVVFFNMLLPKYNPELNHRRTQVNEYGIPWWDKDLVEWIVKRHPDTALSLRSQKPLIRANDMMRDISDIIRKLGHERTLSDAELRRTSDKLAYLTEDGINVEWLRPNLEVKKCEAYLEKKKRDAYEARMAYLERKKRDACKARIVELKQEVKKLELAKSGLKAEFKNEKAKLNPRSFRNLLGNFFCLTT